MVAELIEAGCSPDVAARVVAEAYVSGVESAAFRGHSADIQADERRRKDRERKRLKRDCPQNSADICGNPQNSSSASNTSNITNNLSLEREAPQEKRPRTNRGHRLPEDWHPADPDQAVGVQLLGREGFANEVAKFRDYWAAKPGQGGVKLDWNATFRNWIRNARPVSGQQTAKPLTAHQIERQTSRDILDDLDAVAARGDSRQDHPGFLPGDPSKRPQGLRSGIGGDVIDLPAISYQSRGRPG